MSKIDNKLVDAYNTRVGRGASSLISFATTYGIFAPRLVESIGRGDKVASAFWGLSSACGVVKALLDIRCAAGHGNIPRVPHND